MSKEQREMMLHEDALADEANDTLTRLFRMALSTLNVKPDVWQRRLTSYLKSKARFNYRSAKDIGQERNNFNRAIAKRSITSKTFFKALDVINPIRYCMSISLEIRGRGIVTIETPWYRVMQHVDDDPVASNTVTKTDNVKEYEWGEFDEDDDDVIVDSEDILQDELEHHINQIPDPDEDYD